MTKFTLPLQKLQTPSKSRIGPSSSMPFGYVRGTDSSRLWPEMPARCPSALRVSGLPVQLNRRHEVARPRRRQEPRLHVTRAGHLEQSLEEPRSEEHTSELQSHLNLV